MSTAYSSRHSFLFLMHIQSLKKVIMHTDFKSKVSIALQLIQDWKHSVKYMMKADAAMPGANSFVLCMTKEISLKEQQCVCCITLCSRISHLLLTLTEGSTVQGIKMPLTGY